MGSIVAIIAGYLCNVSGCGALGPYITAAAPNVIDFSITFRARAHAVPNVFGFSTTFSPRPSAPAQCVRFSAYISPTCPRSAECVRFSAYIRPLSSETKYHLLSGIRIPISKWYLLLCYSAIHSTGSILLTPSRILILTLSRHLMLNTQLVGDHGDKFRIRWLGFGDINRVAE